MSKSNPICCDQTTTFEWCMDDPNKGYAFNLFYCSKCMAIFKENVWNSPGIIKICADNSTKTIDNQ